ncbi:MAG: DUF4352 domain-containing protein [Firmicutes bacterium]|nr:DUF4352 domain-containing protein [Bacillota bacterium]
MNKKIIAGCGCGCMTVIVGIIFFMIVGSAVSKNDTSKKNNDVNITPSAQTTESNIEENTEMAENAEEPSNLVEIGGSFEKDGLKFTVNDADTNYQVENDEYGFYKPDEGYKYIAVSFTFENSGEYDRYVSIYDFDCYADNTKCEQEYLMAGTKNDFVNANLSSGRNVSFTTFYSIPLDSNEIELEYEPNFWSDKKIIIKIQ